VQPSIALLEVKINKTTQHKDKKGARKNHRAPELKSKGNMKNILIALIMGIVAGIIDVIPMVIQKLDMYSCVSAFIHWVVLGLVIPYVTWNIKPWLKGLLIAELTAISIMIIVYPQYPISLIPMIIFSAILGAGVGVAGAKFVR
jgi:hypothetical protein